MSNLKTNKKLLRQVATPRVRTAVKAVIPHVDDHVSKLQSLGVMTQNKLADISAAAAAAGITHDLHVPRNNVSTGELWFPAFYTFILPTCKHSGRGYRLYWQAAQY